MTRQPGIIQALTPIAILVFLLAMSSHLFGSDSSYGPNQIALILSAAAGILIGLYNGNTWKELEQGIVKGISHSTAAMIILLVVGSLIGTWILCGTVPTMIYYGLQILNPKIFYAAACIISSIVSLATGSSWTTAGTVGIALTGISTAMGLNPGITAGAIISGAYFGDKISPLSDTTNLAPAMAGTTLFVHIRHMMWTTIPSMAIALTLFTILGLNTHQSAASPQLQGILTSLRTSFNLGPHLLLPPLLVFFLVYKRMPAFPALLIGTLFGGIMAVLFQQDVVVAYADSPHLSKTLSLVKGFWMAMFQEYTSATGNAALDDLLSRGGMASMLNTVWLIFSAMIFGAIMETTLLLNTIAGKIMALAKSTGSLVATTLATCIGTNLIAGDQYIAIVLPGRMYQAEFKKRGLAPENLSRCLEDAGTLTSALVPWNSGGAYMSQNLGVPTLTYLPFCFFNLLNPVISAFYGYTGISIKKLEESETEIESV